MDTGSYALTAQSMDRHCAMMERRGERRGGSVRERYEVKALVGTKVLQALIDLFACIMIFLLLLDDGLPLGLKLSNLSEPQIGLQVRKEHSSVQDDAC